MEKKKNSKKITAIKVQNPRATAPMLLRASISRTKKFFQKTVQTFKSFLSPDYQRLPKSPPRTNPFSSIPGVIDPINLSQNYKELDKFYADFTDQWDAGKSKRKMKTKKKKRSDKKIVVSSPMDDEKEVDSGSLMKFRKWREDHEEEKKMKRIVLEEGKIKEEGRICWVQQKLKELEMVEWGNVEHVLDIEEVLHFYSRLTCPAYVEIVDKFFMDIYTEFSGHRHRED